MITPVLALAAGAAVLGIPGLRRQVLTRHIQRAYARALPRMSETEAAALEAGTSGAEAAFFVGEFNPRAFEARAPQRLSAEEQAFIADIVDPLLKRLDDYAIMQAGDLPAEVWAYLREHRFFGLCIPKDQGGLGFSHRAHSDIVMRIAAVSASTAVTVMVPNSLGPAELLMHYGTPDQKTYWVPRLARGEEIPCFALTSPWAGSDAASIPDTGVIVPLDPSAALDKPLPVEQLGLRLRWNKRYITLAPVATVMGLAFQTQDPNNLLGRGENLGISVALIPANHPGVNIGKRHRPMNAAFMNGPTEGDDVVIPLQWVIGGAEKVGHGWRMLMECLSTGRAISLPANGVALTKQTAVVASRYARVREQFKMPVGKFHAVAQPLAQIGINAHLSHCLRTFAVDALDAGERSSVASAIAKYHLTEMARESVLHGMDIVGGKGICQGPSNLLGTGWLLSPIAITVEGANILTRSLIIFGQGAVRSHPNVLEEMRTAKDSSPEGLARFDRAFWSHMRKVGFDTLRADLSKFAGIYQPAAKTELSFLATPVRQAQRLAINFSFITEMLMLRLGGDLKRLELLSARLGDVVSYLYMAAAVYRDAAQREWPEDQASKERRLLVETSMHYALYRAEQAMVALMDNVPGGLMRFYLKQATMPLGPRIPAMKDSKWLALANAMLNCPEVVAMFEDGLLPGASLESGTQRDLAHAHSLVCKLTRQAPDRPALKDAQLRDPSQLAHRPDGLQAEVAEYRRIVDRLIQVDSFGEWRSSPQ
jgi:acyl-CoA dehydrogenase